jgi:hypothetical protein
MTTGVDQLTIGHNVDEINLDSPGLPTLTYKGTSAFSVTVSQLNPTTTVPLGITPSSGTTAEPDAMREYPITPPGTDKGRVFRVRCLTNVGGNGSEILLPENAFTNMPDLNRIITTGERNEKRVQPPKPPIDGLSRLHPIISLVAPLMQPGWAVSRTRVDSPAIQNLAASGANKDLTPAKNLPVVFAPSTVPSIVEG